jgi:hypothetical protein
MAFQTSTRSSLEADDARSEPLGTRLRASAYRKVSSTDEAECVAHDGGHDGHLADVEAFRHRIAAAVGVTSML